MDFNQVASIRGYKCLFAAPVCSVFTCTPNTKVVHMLVEQKEDWFWLLFSKSFRISSELHALTHSCNTSETKCVILLALQMFVLTKHLFRSMNKSLAISQCTSPSCSLSHGFGKQADFTGAPLYPWLYHRTYKFLNLIDWEGVDFIFSNRSSDSRASCNSLWSSGASGAFGSGTSPMILDAYSRQGEWFVVSLYGRKIEKKLCQ